MNCMLHVVFGVDVTLFEFITILEREHIADQHMRTDSTVSWTVPLLDLMVMQTVQ